MTKLISVLMVSTLLLYIAITFTVKYINSNEESSIKDKILGRAFVSLLGGLAISILFVKYFFNVQFFRFCILILYVTISGYLDYYTKSVYSFISCIFASISLAFLGMDLYYGELKSTLIGIIGSFIISFLFYKIKTFGSGDVEVFSIAAAYIGGSISIFNIILAGSIAGIIIIFKSIIALKFSFKRKVVLCPFIAVSTFLILFFM